MDCNEAQENILESLTGQLAPEHRLDVENHIASCATCAGFAEIQRSLDARLTASSPAAQLSPDFRAALQVRVRRDPLTAWPDFLPDIAHLIGCGVAIGLLVFLLPLRPQTVLAAGAAFTGATYI